MRFIRREHNISFSERPSEKWIASILAGVRWLVLRSLADKDVGVPMILLRRPPRAVSVKEKGDIPGKSNGTAKNPTGFGSPAGLLWGSSVEIRQFAQPKQAQEFIEVGFG